MKRTNRHANVALLLAGALGLWGCSSDTTETSTTAATTTTTTTTTTGQGGAGGAVNTGGAGGDTGTGGAGGAVSTGGAGGSGGAPALAVGLADPKQDKLHGKTVSEWTEAYFKWMMGGGTLADADQGDVFFMPLPQGADLDPNDANAILTGELTIDVPAGKPIFLPLAGWTTEKYKPELSIPEDEPTNDACFDPKLDKRDCVLGDFKGSPVYTWVTLDGKQVALDQSAFYTGYSKWAEPFDYPAPSDYGSIAATGTQGLVVMIEGLPAGAHTVTNYVDFGIAGFFFDNTWKLTAKDVGPYVAQGPLADESAPAIEAGINDPTKQVEGKTSGEWFVEYWKWLLTGADDAANQARPVFFLPLPNGADPDETDKVVWIKGHLDVTVPAGKPFFLPVAAWMSESYTDASGKADDTPAADACYDPALDPRGCSMYDRKYDTARIYVTLDGKEILANQSAFYYENQAFSPAIAYPEPNPDSQADAAISCQGIGFLAEPLANGTHEITLFVDYGCIGQFVYDNTWTITVP